MKLSISFPYKDAAIIGIAELFDHAHGVVPLRQLGHLFRLDKLSKTAPIYCQANFAVMRMTKQL